MIILEAPNAESTTFKILLIASEIIIPLIVFIGAYYIFKPVMEKQAKEKEEQEKKAKEEAEKISSNPEDKDVS